MVGTEACDDGPGIQCLDDCSGPYPGYACISNQCSPICGDGMVLGAEKCDAGKLEGCKPDCSSNLENFNCTGGDALSQTICTEIKNEEEKYVQIS